MSQPQLSFTPASLAATVEGCLDAFQRELDYVFCSFRRLGARPWETDDLAQDLFLILRRSWATYDAARPLRPYLFGIAARIMMAHKRKRRREVTFPTFELVADSGPGPEAAFHSKESRAMLLAAIKMIPLSRRIVLIMHELDEVPVAQVASELSIPRFTVYSRLRKARYELAVLFRRMLKKGQRLIPLPESIPRTSGVSRNGSLSRA